MSKRYLLVQLGSFGDCLYATTIAKQIKKNEPESHLTWAISEKYKSILIGNPDVDAVWEISNSEGYIFGTAHRYVEKEAEIRKNNGEFDQIIFSQILPKNIYVYNGTIRSSILQSYGRKIDVDVTPTLNLSYTEVNNVNNFILKNNILDYTFKILFECGPTSNQSKKINLDFALEIAKKITSKRSDTCFILSSNKTIEKPEARIFDANSLTFRENAELINHCNLLVGCSSGITWLATSSWCSNKINQVQLLDKNYPYFAGVCYDLQLWSLTAEKIVERVDFDHQLVVEMIDIFTEKDFSLLKKDYHQIYKVGYAYWHEIISYGINNYEFIETFKFINAQKNNIHKLNYFKSFFILFHSIYKLIVSKIKNKI